MSTSLDYFDLIGDNIFELAIEDVEDWKLFELRARYRNVLETNNLYQQTSTTTAQAVVRIQLINNVLYKRRG